MNLEVKSVKDTATRDWKALEAKIAADIQALKVGIAQREREAGHAEHTAERLEWEAGFAIDYAVASIEQAELAVLMVSPTALRPSRPGEPCKLTLARQHSAEPF